VLAYSAGKRRLQRTCPLHDRPGAGGRAPRGLLVLSCAALLGAIAKPTPAQDAATGTLASGEDATTLDTIRVIAPAPRMEELYRSRPLERTPPTVFDRAWREPISLEEIGNRDGIIPVLLDYAARKLAGGTGAGARGAVARPPPLDEQQMERALRLQQDTAQHEAEQQETGQHE
jgi:hypothetical protein